MVTSYDDKGKIFTQVISKHPVQVTIQTGQNIIRGSVHVRQNARVKDELDEQQHFLAVTDAVVYSQAQEELYRASFLVVNTHHIVWIIPEEEISK
jgi:uncharacterized protein YcfJ